MHIFLNVTGKEPKEMELAELIEKVLKKKEGWDKNLGEGKNLGPEEDTSFMAARIWAGGDGEGKTHILPSTSSTHQWREKQL